MYFESPLCNAIKNKSTANGTKYAGQKFKEAMILTFDLMTLKKNRDFRIIMNHCVTLKNPHACRLVSILYIKSAYKVTS